MGQGTCPSGWDSEPKAGQCWLVPLRSLLPSISSSPISSLPSSINRSTEVLLWAFRSVAKICLYLLSPIIVHKPCDPQLVTDSEFSDRGSVPPLKPVQGFALRLSSNLVFYPLLRPTIVPKFQIQCTFSACLGFPKKNNAKWYKFTSVALNNELGMQ